MCLSHLNKSLLAYLLSHLLIYLLTYLDACGFSAVNLRYRDVCTRIIAIGQS